MTSRRKPKLPTGVRQLDNGKYQARYSVTVGGITRQHSAGTFTRMEDAKAALSIAKAQLATGEHIDPSGPRQTFQDWAAEFVELTGLTNERRTASFVRVHLLPYWSRWQLGEITVSDVQRWANLLFASDLAPATSHAIYGLFKRIMRAAVDYDRLHKSPCRLVRLPHRAKSAPVRLSAADLRALEAAAPARFAAMVHLSAWTGMRWQECAALRWEHVDLSRGMVTVCEAVKIDGQVGTTKNRKTREVFLAPATVEVLRNHRRDFGSDGLLFTGAKLGRLLNYSYFRTSTWLPTVGRSGVQGNPTFHDLRHGYVSQMIEAGLDAKVISDQVGHHAASFTLDNYGSTRPDRGAVVAAAVEKAQSAAN